jgi:hypothetical protein
MSEGVWRSIITKQQNCRIKYAGIDRVLNGYSKVVSGCRKYSMGGGRVLSYRPSMPSAFSALLLEKGVIIGPWTVNFLYRRSVMAL